MNPLLFLLILLVSNHKPLLSALNDEGLALLSFKQSLQGDTGSYLINWNSSDPNPCSWHGVSGRNHKVHALVVPNIGLSGYLSPALVNLSSIRHVNLENNSFHGMLPIELFAATRLKSIELSGNSLYGPLPTEVGNLKNLQTLDLSRNSFNGTVPSSIVQCKRLTTLVPSLNCFIGSLPGGLGNSLVGLQKLNLSYNSFSGSIPIDIGNLSNLHGTLDLSHNFFTGEIPASLVSLSEELYTDLSYNNLTGPIPQNGALGNAGPTAFIGNPLLCGLPLKISCNPDSSNANSQTSFRNPIQSSSRNSIKVGKGGHSSSRRAIKIVTFVMAGVCFTGFLFSYWYKKASVCIGVRKATGYRLEEKLMIGRGIFCFAKKDMDTLSENMEQCNFVPLDTEVDFDLEQLLKASAFLLGKSSSGILYKVVLDNGLAVAVRRLGDGGGQRIKGFQTEVEAIGKIRHPNVVSLRAYCCSDDEKLLIYDYITNGNLTAAIHGKSGIPFKPLSWPVRVKIIKGIAKGLAFLHEFSPKRYVHGNLKPSNILLVEDMEPCISDFGLSRLTNITDESPEFQVEQQMAIWTSQQSSPYELTAINQSSNGSYYRAPEALNDTKPSQKWDVYSFGVILLEMISGKLPSIQVGSSEIDLVQWLQLGIDERKPLSSLIDPSMTHRGGEEDNISAILKLALTCTHKSPDRRPSIRFVSYSFEKLTS
ncbi:putative Spliceosomal U5 snRNP-specific 15 kDa protein [Hibiscus syriacus]|uniref:Spliceosomal U5 snRNP-specific 15 kDa protein n=1 Tax=Hibiscus syriacus TaxID=106335 RepID=A0A6A2ZUU6_HIBSY|nr:receptor protein kinase-like protein ZAR1 [Hibiscus syriacus]KAE8695197.1 putative Spliceosomal U5 snRNP-specific 15 kDa protein [Hibiscus syriacus]